MFCRLFENVINRRNRPVAISPTAPVVVAGGSSLDETIATPQTFTVSASDGGDGVASYVLVTPPLGDISFTFNTSTGEYDWHPNGAFESLGAGQSAIRQFRWKALNDSGQSSRTVTETLTITGVNDPPVAVEETITLLATEGSIGGFFDWTDIDSSSLYSPVAFEITSALAATNLGDNILLETGDALLLESGDNLILETATGAGIGTFTLVDAATGEWLYETDGDFDDLDAPDIASLTLTWRVRDAEGDWSDPKELLIDVYGVTPTVENFPVMTPIQLITLAGDPISVDLIDYTTDGDGDYSAWVIADQPIDAQGNDKGSVALSTDGTYATGTLTFYPGNEFDDILAGSSEVVVAQVYALDGAGNPSNTINVECQVNGTAIANPPNAQNISLTVEYNAANVTGQCVATDPDGDLDASGYAKVSDPAEGILDISATGAITFQPNSDFDDLTNGQSRQVVGTYTASDDLAAVSAPASITVTVTNSVQPGSPPVILNRMRACDWQASFIEGNLLNHTTDADGDIDSSSFVLSTDVAEGSLTTSPAGASLGYWRFAPGTDFNDLLSGGSRDVYFEATVADFEGRVSAPGRITIRVTRPVSTVQVAPVAVAYAFSVDADATHTGPVTPATDADGDLNLNGYAMADSGNAVLDGVCTIAANGIVNYDPNGVFDGLMMGQSVTRVFTYTASDAGGRISTPASITVTINGVAAMAMEPMYPDAARAAFALKYPFEETAMSRVMALETAYPADRSSTKSGSWSDATVWSPTGVPQAGENVMIHYGHSVTFNEAREAVVTDNKLYGFIHCHGTLSMSSLVSTRLRCDTLIGHYGAHLSLQPSSGVISEISFPGGPSDIDVSKDPSVVSNGIIWHGTCTVKDPRAGTSTEKDPYVLCSRSVWPMAGHTTVTLQAAPVGWENGDLICIPRTEQASALNSTPTAEDEFVTITNISANVVTFTPALTYDHDDLDLMPPTPTFDSGLGDGTGGDYPELAICNFTRNIKFTNEMGNAGEIHHRPHIMLMHRTDSSGVVWCDSQITDFGRTNKRVNAFTPLQMGTNPIIADSNMKGRYSLHMHWCGIDPDSEVYTGMAMISRNALFRSPGWHIALHRSSANIIDNVSWSAFSHIHVESGDEIGNVRGNIAINCHARRSSADGLTGTVPITKKAEFVNNFDMGNTGQGAFFQSRLVASWASARGWNRVYGSEGDAVVWMHRGPYVTASLDFGNHRAHVDNWDHGAAVGYDILTMDLDQPHITRVQNWQVTGAQRGLHVIKANPAQFHGLRTFFKDIYVTATRNGIEWQYTQHYTAQRFCLMMSSRIPANHADTGFLIFNNTPDMTLTYGKIAGAPGATNGGFTRAIDLTHDRTGTNPEPVAGGWGYIFDSILFGTQAGGVNNVSDMPTFLPTRTGPDGVTATEDQAFNMTFRNPATGLVETFPAPPHPYTTLTNTMALHGVSNAPSPAAQSQWTFGVSSQYLGTITDAYGTVRNPLYYGTSGAHVASNGSNDFFRRLREQVGGLLLHEGYWQEQATGRYFCDDFIGISSRARDTQTMLPVRLYLANNTPGIAGNNPSAFLGGGATFTFNGTKA